MRTIQVKVKPNSRVSALEQMDDGAQLREILSRATAAGQLYALLGLRLRDRAAYEQSVAGAAKALRCRFHRARLHPDEGGDGRDRS